MAYLFYFYFLVGLGAISFIAFKPAQIQILITATKPIALIKGSAPIAMATAHARNTTAHTAKRLKMPANSDSVEFYKMLRRQEQHQLQNPELYPREPTAEEDVTMTSHLQKAGVTVTSGYDTVASPQPPSR